jgi:hypothetical protein
MSVAISVAEVFADVAFRLHLPAFASGEFVSDTEALRLFRGSLGRLSGLLTRLYGDDLFAETATVQTQAGFDSVSLPQDFHTLRSVHWVYNNEAHELSRARPSDVDSGSGGWSTHCMPQYALEAYTLRLYPTPQDAYVLRIGYTTTLTVANASATLYGNVGWQEWLTNDMCERIRMREQKPFAEFTQARMEAEMEIRDQATQRDRFAVMQARDTRGELSSARQYFRYRRPW